MARLGQLTAGSSCTDGRLTAHEQASADSLQGAAAAQEGSDALAIKLRNKILCFECGEAGRFVRIKVKTDDAASRHKLACAA